MRKLLYISAFLLSLTACDIHMSDNGDLDGYWQLRSVDTLSGGGVCDMRDSMKFWSFQADLLHLRDNRLEIKNIFMRFKISEDVMTLTNPVIDLRDSSDKVLTDYTMLRHYGVHNMPETLRIVSLSSSAMTLESNTLRLNFRKY